jgi:hypothetical protein
VNIIPKANIVKEKEGGIAKILPVVDLGKEDLGYQYLIRQKEGTSFKFLPDEPWSLDFNSDEDASLETLEKIVRLMLYDDYVFVIKNKDSGLNDGFATAIFGRQGFMNIQDFYSNSGPQDINPEYINQRMRMNAFNQNFDTNDFIRWNIIWKATWDIFTRYTNFDIKKFN